MTPEIMTSKDLARYLSVHLITVYRWLERGAIKGTKIGNTWRFKKTEVDEMFKNNEFQCRITSYHKYNEGGICDDCERNRD